MAQVYKFSEKEIEEIAQARTENKDKRAEARLKALEMRTRGANRLFPVSLEESGFLNVLIKN